MAPKMGKSVSGAGLAARGPSLPSYDYWQFWRNTDDRDVGRFLRLFTEPADCRDSRRLEKLDGAGDQTRRKKILADEATARCAAARVAAAAAAETARRTFDEGEAGDALPTLKVVSGRDRHHRGEHRAGLCRVQRRGAAQDRRGRGPGRRREDHRPEFPHHHRRPAGQAQPSARSGTRC